MDNRYRYSSKQEDYRDRNGRRDRQSEQFSTESDDQYGEGGWRSREGGNFDRGYDRNENFQREDFNRAGSGFRSDTSSLDDYDRANVGPAYGAQRGRPSGYGSDAYAFDRYAPSRNTTGYGERSYGGSSLGSGSYDRGGIPPRQFDRDERGFFDRASDEVMSWFGDDDAARRRKMDHREDYRGKGPANYARSNERLLEDACERLTRDPLIDASKIDVACADNEVTLSGTVDSRSAKRRAEDIVDDISGVKHVQNNLRVESRDRYYSETSTLTES